MVQVLLPIKDFVQAKTRLSGVLAPHERRALMQAMVEDVLIVLSGHPDIDGVLLVSDDPAAELLAGKYGIEAVDERSLGCKGLNGAITAASQLLVRQGVKSLLVMHGDVPLLGFEDVTEMLKRYQQPDIDVVIAPDERGVGTNSLLFATHQMPLFQFGVDSCNKHMQSIGDSGLKVERVDRLGLAMDIDEPADLHRLVSCLESGRGGVYCRQLLIDGGIRQRLAAMAEYGFEHESFEQNAVSEG